MFLEFRERCGHESCFKTSSCLLQLGDCQLWILSLFPILSSWSELYATDTTMGTNSSSFEVRKSFVFRNLLLSLVF